MTLCEFGQCVVVLMMRRGLAEASPEDLWIFMPAVALIPGKHDARLPWKRLVPAFGVFWQSLLKVIWARGSESRRLGCASALGNLSAGGDGGCLERKGRAHAHVRRALAQQSTAQSGNAPPLRAVAPCPRCAKCAAGQWGELACGNPGKAANT